MQRFNVKNVEGWLLLFWWIFLLGFGLPYLLSAPSTLLVLFGVFLFAASTVYSSNYLVNRVKKEIQNNAQDS